MASRGVTVKDVGAKDFVRAYAKHLKRSGRVQVPKWVDTVKNGTQCQLPPQDKDWFYVRTASIARKLYIRGSVGTGAFKKVYGGAKNNGAKPTHFQTSSGAVIRNAIHGLEKMGLVEKDKVNGGRKITVIGQRDLDRIAQRVSKEFSKQ